MSSSLGLYIENNVIKYAKLTKDHDNIRIDSFGMKFYDNIDETVKQIINETYSYKIPISVNLSDEKYTYADLFSLLNKKDLEKAVDTEFDYFCNETGKNKNATEYRRILVPNLEDRDKITSLYVYSDRANIVGKLQILDAYKVNNVVPLPITIANLKKDVSKKNIIIVNIEKNTSVTTLVNNEVHRVDIIENGMKEILDSIIVKENSYAKAYEICKNSTIYTSQGRNLQIEENEYMEDIMPVLYKIVEQVGDLIKANGIEIGEIYISGLATAINNIDLYFQENFPDKKCEILTPYFIKKTNVKLNIKDYIEVNSAIALALQGLGEGIKDINFKNKGKLDQLSQILTVDVGGHSNNKPKNKEKQNKQNGNFAEKLKNIFKTGLSGSTDNIEKMMIRFSTVVLMVLIVYSVFAKLIMNQISNKETQIQAFIEDAQAKIDDVSNKTALVNKKTEQYNSILDKIEQTNAQLTQSYARKKAIPNFLTSIMTNIPKEVQLLSIKNTTGKTIKMVAQAKDYEQLGYFIAKIKNEGILTDVTATSGERLDEFIKITIEGNLPY